jgi:hypothetical protein
MIAKEHASPEGMREVFARLKALAMGEMIRVVSDDGEVSIQLRCKPEYMRMYLDRVLGPVRDVDAVDAAVQKRLGELLEHAERESQRRDEAITVTGDVKP